MAAPGYIVDGVLTDGEAWVGLNTTTLGSDTATVTFKSGFDDTDTDVGGVQSWDQYMDLVLISYARSTVAAVADGSLLTLNNDTGANYAYQYMYGDGSSAVAASGTANYFWINNAAGASAAANIFGIGVFHMFDINSGKYKSATTTNAGDRDGSGAVLMYGYTWENQAAVTEIDINNSANHLSGSMFSLFGILPSMLTTGTLP